jgi:hypothetical protein
MGVGVVWVWVWVWGRPYECGGGVGTVVCVGVVAWV